MGGHTFSQRLCAMVYQEPSATPKKVIAAFAAALAVLALVAVVGNQSQTPASPETALGAVDNFWDSATDTYTTPPPTPAPTLPPSLKQLIADTVKLNPWVSPLALTPPEDKFPVGFWSTQGELSRHWYHLSWAGKGLKELPESIVHFSRGDVYQKLWLNVSHNELTSLPASIGNLNVESGSLDLSHNNLASLPASMGDNLFVMHNLYLNNNKLTSLPASFAHISFGGNSNLYLNNNKLTSLPASFGNLKLSLSRLYLNNNKLTGLPASFSNLEGPLRKVLTQFRMKPK